MTYQELPSYDQAPAGAIRFNTDSRKLEVYCGGPVGYGTLPNGQWMQVDSFTPDIATGGTRGVVAGGYVTPGDGTSDIDYFTISTTGNALDFGSLLTKKRISASCSSSTRGIVSGGYNETPGAHLNTIEYLTISSTGNSIFFGELNSVSFYAHGGCSNSTRGIFAGGAEVPTTPAYSNVIQYITIASLGNAQDFGDLQQGRRPNSDNGVASSTRGVFSGGVGPTAGGKDTIEFITIASLGNASTFGELTLPRQAVGSCSNSIRGVQAGGEAPSPTLKTTTIDYFTISTIGNAMDFGDLTTAKYQIVGASSATRGTFSGGTLDPATNNTNVIEYVQIMSTGNAVDFGDLTYAAQQQVGLSNGHGGL